MRNYFILLASSILFLTGCTNSKMNHHQSIIDDYEAIEKRVGKSVTLTGYVSLTHGATGIYFSKRDLINENGKCILPVPFNYSSHGDEITITGLLTKTDCGFDSICTNVCAGFKIMSEDN